jgi:hypothetical protein
MAARGRASYGSFAASSAALERVWNPKVHVVWQIEEFRPELQVSGFRTQRKVLLKRQIPITEAGTPENTIPGISKDVECRRNETACVVVLRDRPARELTVANTVRNVAVSVVQSA